MTGLGERLALAAGAFGAPPVRPAPASAGEGFEVRRLPAPPDLPAPGDLEPLTGAQVRRAIVLDVESSGLAIPASVPFVVGLLDRTAGAAAITVFVLREPAAEAAMLEAVADFVAGRAGPGTWLVTFNGTRFDLPLLSARLGRLAGRSWPGVPHLDVLPHARRLLRFDVPRRNLGALEAHLLGIRRAGDLGGAEVPAVFAALRAGPGAEAARALEKVVAHNVRDLEGLGRVAGRLAGIERRPRTLGQAVGVARRLARRSPQAAADVLAPFFEAEAREAARRCPELAAEAATVLVRALVRCGGAPARARAAQVADWAARHVPFDPRPSQLVAGGRCKAAVRPS